MELSELVRRIRNYEGIRRKSIISQVCSALPYPPEHVLASFGEDAAVIRHGDSDVLLLACDGIMESIIRKNPFWAGYCSVLVNANDIAAMGGTPVAMVNVLSVGNRKILGQILRGMGAAIRKFGIPMVGGHTHPDSKTASISVSILGTARKSDVIYSHTAGVGDSVVFAYDLGGKFTRGLAYSWDTTSFKVAGDVRRKTGVMQVIARNRLATAAKDISMPGTLGTLGMLLESSGKGAEVNIDAIPAPRGVPLLRWVKAYQGCGFVLTCKRENEEEIVAEFGRTGMAAAAVGKVTKEKRLVISWKNRKETLFDFKKGGITGLGNFY